ncbi:MAG: hypothetical protein ABI402_18250 [Ferruginibacter sp.]
MKKILSTVTAGFFISILMISCNDASKKDMADADKNLKEAKQDIKEAVITSNDSAKANAISNWKSFKNESDSAIAGMEKDVITIEKKMTKADDAAKATLKTNLDKTNKKLKDLKEKMQQRNAEFENDINEFDANVAAKNQSFQREFRHDMNELGTAFKDLFKDNVK